VVIRQRPRPQRGPPCATARPDGLPTLASAGLRVPDTVASSHPATRLPAPMAGHRRPPPLAALASHHTPSPSPLCPLRGLTGPLLLRSRLCFPSGAGCLHIPYEVVPRFRSTPFLWRLHATKTLLRSAAFLDQRVSSRRQVSYSLVSTEDDMSSISLDEGKLKDLLKTAIVEVLEERKDLVRDLLEEAC
jgi:hypothetical protein